MGGWLRNVPNEVLETEVPVLVEQYRYRRGSGGDGAFTGGDGLIIELRSLDDDVTFAVRGLERLTFQPWGVRGGEPGQRGRATLNPGTPGARDLGRVGTVTLNRGDVLRVETPGGGGLGERPADGDLFALGDARDAYDRRWPARSQRALGDAVLGAVPFSRQATTYRALYLDADRRAGDGPVTDEIVHAALAAAGLRRNAL